MRPAARLALLALLAVLAVVSSTFAATSIAAQESAPEIRFDGNTNLLKLPASMNFGEVAGVAVNSQKHIFAFVRSGVRSTVHGETASQLFEFGPDGTYIREIGQNLYGFAFAHTVRIDTNDNIWATDEGTNMIIKFSPAGKVLMVLGRREEAVEPAPTPAPGAVPRPQWGGFNRPTDVAWDRAGNIFVADGYNNSRVVKIDSRGRWVKTWGTRGTETGQFNILHSIATDAKGNVYVGDRSNRRIQVFDGNGTFLKQFTIDVPFTKPVNVMLGGDPSSGNPLAVSGAPWAICITPGNSQFLYVADAVPGRIYKLTLDGKVLGVLGEAGKEPKQFGWIHEIACPSENELYVAELLNWRMQKLTLRP
ncbi:MAG TPA: peptidyl-alpha-hydroxyglycine alpha-amidating lyase family protein [Gemmatimonadaceae bacterium]|jgi:sugar lactone lactonase YvrE|nr:peptidyl-alpha-hydroxyglycine alpha-amidating lyase family protein [Gemmatimonadaceae bacterium]